MALPSNEMKKPLTAPKPQGISIFSPENKGISSSGRQLIDKQQKIKPPLLPKPDIKSKPIFSAKTSVINSNNVSTNNINSVKHHDETDSVKNSSNDEKCSSNEKNNIESYLKTDKKSSINNVVNIFQSKIEESMKSRDKIFHADKCATDYNVSVDNMSLKDNFISSSESNITKSVNNSQVRENFSSNSNIRIHESTSEISNQSIISNVNLKSRIGKFETILSNTKYLHPQNDYLKGKNDNDTLGNISVSKTNRTFHGNKHDISTVSFPDSYDSKKNNEFSQIDCEKNKSSTVQIPKHDKNIEHNSRKSRILEKADHEQSCADKISKHPIIQRKDNYLENSKECILLKQDALLIELSKETEISSTEASFLHRKNSRSLISSSNNDIIDVKENSSIIDTKMAFLDKIKNEILSEKRTPEMSEIGSLKKKHFSDDLWKTRSLGPTIPDVTNERSWSLNSLKQKGFSQSYFTDMFNQLRSPIMNGNENFRIELNNKLKRRSTSRLDDSNNMLESKFSASGSPKDSTDNIENVVIEEPIYWEIEAIVPNENLKNTTDNNHSLDLPTSQAKRDHQEDEDFPSYLSDMSDNSDVSNSSWSDIEDASTPIKSTTLHSLVKATLNLTDNNVQNNMGVTSNDSNRNLQKLANSEVRKISTSKNSKVQRSASDRSTKSRQEDVESIGSNSTENSYSMTKRLSSWFGSFGKGSKRSSLFYCESSPDQSILDHTYSNFSHEATESNDLNFTAYPEYVNIQDSKPQSIEEVSEKRKRKAFLVAQEVMTSEKMFVDVLSLLCKDMKTQCCSDIPETELEKIITPLPQLLCLNEDILKDIRGRISNWETLPKISDIFVKKGPFLKLYSSYIQNFEAQCNFFDECCQKYLLFNKKVKEFELSDFCKKLSVKHYMLKPIQRIPQYRLLLEDYLNNLEPESVDFEDTQKALQIVRNVAEHANKSMKQGDHLCKLLQIQSQLGNYELIKPGRVFIKEGELLKLSRRGGLQERFIILLSDCLLYTSYYGTMSGLRVNYELPLNGMKVCLPQTEDYNNEFNIITVRRSFTLRARSDAERQEWINALQTAIKENQEHFLSFLNRQLETQHSSSEIMLGKVAPLWITDSRVSMCQQCTSLFTVTFRRHHCRACGRVVCGPCSDYEAPLQYQKFKNSRVCEECFHYLVKEFDNPDRNMFDRIKSVLNIEEDQEVQQTFEIIRSNFKKMGTVGSRKYHSKKSRKHMPLRLIEVTANDSGSQMSGWLFKKSGRNWKRCWFVLKEQVLYKYKASEDIAALKSIPVLGYEIENLNEQDNFKYVFQLKHQGQDPLVFAVDNEQSFSRWVIAMTGATTLS